MTNGEKADVQALIDSLPRCSGWGMINHKMVRCEELATLSCPSPALGERELRCAGHVIHSNGLEEGASPTRWAAAVEKLVEHGFSRVRAAR